jgi:hypothetical protein
MNYLESLAKLKQSISNAKYLAATPEYHGLALDSELETIECIVDALRENRDEEIERV